MSFQGFFYISGGCFGFLPSTVYGTLAGFLRYQIHHKQYKLQLQIGNIVDVISWCFLGSYINPFKIRITHHSATCRTSQPKNQHQTWGNFLKGEFTSYYRLYHGFTTFYPGFTMVLPCFATWPGIIFGRTHTHTIEAKQQHPRRTSLHPAVTRPVCGRAHEQCRDAGPIPPLKMAGGGRHSFPFWGRLGLFSGAN